MFSEKIDDLFSLQLREWELAKFNYEQLGKVMTREFDFNTFKVYIQFNPERIRSSSAKVDVKSIIARPCFLCDENRPAVQRGVPFNENLIALINPFPIFRKHLTITSKFHTDQRIRNNFGIMLLLAESMPLYTVFYNGPECGASAPDHFHLQAGSKEVMPIENDFTHGKNVKMLSGRTGIEIWQWTGYKRGIISITGNNKQILTSVFNTFFDRFAELQPDRPEPMLNILASYSSLGWTVHIIPRKKHRPNQFFNEGSDQMLISPAAVDLAGMIITPREEDFIKITRTDIEDIFSQVCYSDDELSCLINVLL